MDDDLTSAKALVVDSDFDLADGDEFRVTIVLFLAHPLGTLRFVQVDRVIVFAISDAGPKIAFAKLVFANDNMHAANH